MKKAILVILLIAAVALGAMHGHYTFLRSRGYIDKEVGFFAYLKRDYKIITTPVAKEGKDYGKTAEADIEKNKPERRPPIDRRRPVAEAPPHVEKTKPPVPEADIERVAGIIEKARSLYTASDYQKAADMFDEAAKILEKAGRNGSPQHEEAVKFAARCHVFDALVKNIPYLELSDGKNLSRIELDSGGTLTARVIQDDGEKVTIRQNDGIEATIPYHQIDDIQSISVEDYRRELVKTYNDRMEMADPKAYFEVFGVALFAIQNRLESVITDSLEKTFILPGSELVMQTFYTGDDADMLIVELLESFDKSQEAQKYRDKFAMAQAPPPEPEHLNPGIEPEPEYPGPEPVEPSPEPTSPPSAEASRTPNAPPGSKEARLAEAGQYFLAGQRFANKATREVSKRSFYGKKAFAELGKARDILNKLQDEYPGDMEVEHMLQQVSDILSFVVHNLMPAK